MSRIWPGGERQEYCSTRTEIAGLASRGFRLGQTWQDKGPQLDAHPILATCMTMTMIRLDIACLYA